MVYIRCIQGLWKRNGNYYILIFFKGFGAFASGFGFRDQDLGFMGFRVPSPVFRV